jgi:hypothetical protein
MDEVDQMNLFGDLPIPPDAAEQHLRRLRMCVPWRLAVLVLRTFGRPRRRVRPEPEQLPLRIVLREPERDDPEPLPVHRLVSAADAPPVETRGVASVFTLADASKAAHAMRTFGRFGAASGFEPAPYRVERSYADGTVRMIRQRPEDTEEWQERERIRRAKQRPPKPTRKAKTRGKKLLEMIGEANDD